jgi:hypothetical protein
MVGVTLGYVSSMANTITDSILLKASFSVHTLWRHHCFFSPFASQLTQSFLMHPRHFMQPFFLVLGAPPVKMRVLIISTTITVIPSVWGGCAIARGYIWDLSSCMAVVERCLLCRSIDMLATKCWGVML